MHSLNKRGASGALPAPMLGRGLFWGEVEQSKSQQWQQAESWLLFLLHITNPSPVHPSHCGLETRNVRAACEQGQPRGKSSSTALTLPCPGEGRRQTKKSAQDRERKVRNGFLRSSRAREAGTRGQSGFFFFFLWFLSMDLWYCSFCQAKNRAQRDPFLPREPRRRS